MPTRERRLREEREEFLYGPRVPSKQIDDWLKGSREIIRQAKEKLQQDVESGRVVLADSANRRAGQLDPEETL